MEMVNYKNVATGLAESFEVGSRGDRKRRDDPKHYTCLNPEVLPKPKPAGEKVTEIKPPDTQQAGKK
jgi:hypothetical protein